MNFTKEFTRGIHILFGASILLAVFSFLLMTHDMHGLSIDNPNSTLRVILNEILYGLTSVAFWVVVGYMTKEKTGSMVAILIQLLYHIIVLTLSLSLVQYTKETFTLMSLLDRIINVTAYVAFGLIHFKKLKGILIGLVYFAVIGIVMGMRGDTYYELMERILRLINIRDPFIYKRHFGTTTSSFNYLQLILYQMTSITQLCVFWFMYHLIKFPKHFNFKLTTTPIINKISPFTFSIIYWVVRLVLFISAVGFIESLQNSIRYGMGPSAIYKSTCFCFGIFVTASMYRNFLSAYMVTKGRFPAVTYWLLNVPILHFIVWIYTLFLRSKPIQITMEETEMNEANEFQSLQVKEDFIANSKNSGLKILMMIILLIILFVPSKLSTPNSTQFGAAESIWSGIVILALSIWYMYDKRLLLPLFIFQTCSLLLMVMFVEPSKFQPVVVFGLVNLLVFYSLFHFDDLKFVDMTSLAIARPNEDKPGNIEVQEEE
ncbi:MAG: hypothetical protein ABJB16_05365 [Saprospiraceae bacterium]